MTKKEMEKKLKPIFKDATWRDFTDRARLYYKDKLYVNSLYECGIIDEQAKEKRLNYLKLKYEIIDEWVNSHDENVICEQIIEQKNHKIYLLKEEIKRLKKLVKNKEQMDVKC